MSHVLIVLDLALYTNHPAVGNITKPRAGVLALTNLALNLGGSTVRKSNVYLDRRLIDPNHGFLQCHIVGKC